MAASRQSQRLEEVDAVNPNPIPNTAHDNLRTEYGAVSNYHSALVQIRFAAAGLYFAGLGLFASQWPQKPTVGFIYISSGTVILLSICLILLDWRTRKLFDFAVSRGIQIEIALPTSAISDPPTGRFFFEMNRLTGGVPHTFTLNAIYLIGIGASLTAFLFADKIAV